MKPIGPLMKEHRVIEKVISSFKKKMEKMRKERKADIEFINDTIDFIRVYADQTHHGKEEDILFKRLEDESLSKEDRQTMDELIEEHSWARKKVKNLEEAAVKYREGDKSSINDIIENIELLVEFYPRHIEKEDDNFFPASMEYLDDKQQKKMLGDFTQFDSGMIHKKYESVQEDLKERE